MNSKNKIVKKNKIAYGITFRHLILISLFLGIGAQLTHFFDAVVTIFSVNNDNQKLEGVLFCLAFGTAIAIWTARGKKRLVLLFSGVEMIVNFYYTIEHSQGRYAVFMGLILGVVLPLSNYFYCEELMFGNSHAVKAIKKTKGRAKPQNEPVPLAA